MRGAGAFLLPTPPRRRPGRPSLDPNDAPSVDVHVRVTPKQFDAIYAQSRAARTSMAEWVRRRLRVDRPRDPRQ
jgi:hypothetical protein